ncbi:MAG: PAS domain S-box protein [bacterium]
MLGVITFDGLADGMTIHDTEYNILQNNRAFAELIPGGYKEGTKCHQLVHGLDAPPAHCPMGEALASKKSKTSEFFEPWVNRYLSVRTDPVLDATGQVVRIIHVVRDITERKQMEEALARAEAEARYRELIENAVYGIFSSTKGGKFLYVNAALVEMLGYESKAELLSSNIPVEIYRDPNQCTTILEEMSRTQRVESREIEWVRKDGKVIIVRLSGRMVSYEQGGLEEFEAIVENVTERRLLEQQLYQSQKMESIGRLAGGVAHDFNNLLNVILGYSNLMLEHLSPDDPLSKRAQAIQNAGERAAALTRQLLAFSRKQVLEPKVVSLNAVVNEAKELLQRLIGEDIELNLALAPALGQVKVDPGQMTQVIMNLAVNARDAMPNGGKLSFETANVMLKDDYVARRPLVSPGPYIMLAVSDTGVGIDQKTQERIFEPFFTTKEKGKGTGLGLSTVYGIVKQSGGFIWVYSEPGQGTTFKIYLPWVEESLSEARGEESPGTFVAGSETILLVEDDEALRELAREFLESAGYDVLEARSGSDAVELARKHEGLIHLLLTDVVLPGASGPELSKNLAITRPGMKVLYVSGYTDNEIVHRGVPDSQVAFLQKPYGKEELLSKIRKILLD